MPYATQVDLKVPSSVQLRARFADLHPHHRHTGVLPCPIRPSCPNDRPTRLAARPHGTRHGRRSARSRMGLRSVLTWCHVGAAGVDDLIHAWFREERMVQTKQARACLSVPGRARDRFGLIA